MLGFVESGFVSGEFGAGSPEDLDAPLKVTGGSRYLNTATRDYEHDSVLGSLRQMPQLHQRIAIAVTTDPRSSSALRKLGLERPRKIGPVFDAEMQAAVRAALKHITDAGDMIINSIKVERSFGGRSQMIIDFDDPNATVYARRQRIVL